MSKAKVIRDVILIIIIAVIAGLLYMNRSKGPVNFSDTPADPHSADMVHPGAGMHRNSSPALADGDPVISLGESYVGQDWFNASLSKFQEKLMSEGSDEESAAEDAVKLAVAESAFELVFAAGVKEFGIEIDPALLAEREQNLYADFGSEAEAEAVFNDMGVTIEQVRKMWVDELTETEIIKKIAELNSLDPESTEAQKAYDDWIFDRMRNAEFTFTDPAHQEFLALYISDIMTQEDTPMGGSMGEASDPHGGNAVGEDQAPTDPVHGN